MLVLCLYVDILKSANIWKHLEKTQRVQLWLLTVSSSAVLDSSAPQKSRHIVNNVSNSP